MKASDQAIWVKGEVALHHITDKKTKWGNEHHGSLPTPRFQHASCVANGKLFIIGGTNGSDILNDFHVFNPLTFTWTEYVAHSSRNKVQDGGRARHTVTFMKDLNALFLFGGVCRSGIADQTLYVLDLSKDLSLRDGTFAWRKHSDQIGQEVPTPRFAHCAVAVCNHLYVFGGERLNKKLSRTMFMYDPIKKEWSRALQHQSAKSMAPPAGKDYRMLVIPEHRVNSGTRHLVVLGTNLKFIYLVPIEKGTGQPISWDSIGALGAIPGAIKSIANNQTLTPVRRQYAACVMNSSDPGRRRSGGRRSNQKNGNNEEECEIIIFGGIVHNPKSALTDDVHSLTIRVEEGKAEWISVTQRGRAVPSARIGHSFSFLEYKSPQTGLINRQLCMFGGTDSDGEWCSIVVFNYHQIFMTINLKYIY